MQRDHEFHTEGPDFFPPSDTLNELPPSPGSSWMGTPIEEESFDGEPFVLRGVQGYFDPEKLGAILNQSTDEGIKAIVDAMWTLMTEWQGGEEDIRQLDELAQRAVERADALDPDVFVAMDPSAPTMAPPGGDSIPTMVPPEFESPMVHPVESEPPLVGGDPATSSPSALDGSPSGEVSQPPPQSQEDPSSASQLRLVGAALDVGPISISGYVRDLEGIDEDREPDNVFVSDLEVLLPSVLQLSSTVDSWAEHVSGDSFWSKESRPYQSMIDPEVHTPPLSTQPFEQTYAVIAV